MENCTKSDGQLVESSQILSLETISDSYVWVNRLAEYTHFVRNEGCYEPRNELVTLTPLYTSGTNRIVSCLERCNDSYLYALKGFSCYCITAEQYLMFSRTNTSSCDTLCPGDARDVCGGKNATSFYKEVKNTVFADEPDLHINRVECAFGVKSTDFFDLRSSGCRQKADGYMCEACIYDNKRCNTTAIQLTYTWYEADENCRDDGGHLGDQYSISGYPFLEDGAYWLGLRRWIVDRSPHEIRNLPPKSCVACRIIDRKLQCDYKMCSEPLQYVCVVPNLKRNCQEDEFHCGDNVCLPLPWRCDNETDCRDGSDEQDCTTTTEALITTVYTTDTEISTVASDENTTATNNNTIKSNVLPGDKTTFLNSLTFTIGSIALAVVVFVFGFLLALIFIFKKRQLKRKSKNIDLLNNIHGVQFERQRSFSNPAFMETEVAVVRTQSNRLEQAQEIEYEPIRCEKGSIQQTGNASSTLGHTGISNDYVSVDLKQNHSNATGNSDHNKNVNDSSKLGMEYMSMNLSSEQYKDMSFKTSPQKDQREQQSAVYTEMEFGGEPQKEWYTEMTFNNIQERDYSNVAFNNTSQQSTYTDMTFKDPHKDAYAECPIVK